MILSPVLPRTTHAQFAMAWQGGEEAEDSYDLVMWQAPAAPDVVHKKTDRLGHRLRGEPEPALVTPPDAEYRWIDKSSLQVAATITVVQGLTRDEVISTFGGDPETLTALSRNGKVASLYWNVNANFRLTATPRA